MLRTLVFSCCAFVMMIAAPVSAQQVMTGSPFMQGNSMQAILKDGIAIVVNDEVITKGDLRARTSLALLSAGLPDTEEARANLLPQVMRALIEESLVRQEAAKLGISIPDEAVESAVARVSADNHVPGGDMRAFLQAKNIPYSTLYHQMENQLAWSQIVMRSIRPHIDVSDEEIDASVQGLYDDAGKQEYLMSEVFLAIDHDSDEKEVKALADKLYEQISAGAVFSSVARQFSQGSSAATGGDVGWILAGELAPEISNVLQHMDTSTISTPIRTGDGYYIVGLRDKRVVAYGDVSKVKVRLGQAVKSATTSEAIEVAMEEAEKIKEGVQGCESVQGALPEGWVWKDIGDFGMESLPKWLEGAVSTLKAGEAAMPMATGKGVVMVYLCERSMPTEVNRDKIRQTIGMDKMRRMSRGYLRDLRRDAFIDVRLRGAV